MLIISQIRFILGNDMPAIEQWSAVSLSSSASPDSAIRNKLSAKLTREKVGCAADRLIPVSSSDPISILHSSNDLVGERYPTTHM